MKKYISLLKYEFKTLVKDSTNLILLFYPVIILFLLGWFLPEIMGKVENNPSETSTGLLIVLSGSLSVGAFMVGALLGFSLIENKDEKTILSISVTPIKIKGYTIFKTVYTYVISVIDNIIIVGGLKLIASDDYVIELNNHTIRLLDNLNWLHIYVFSIVSGLLVPAVALILASFAKNKMEGLVAVKAGGLLMLIPALSILNVFSGYKQYILGITPNFWPIKAMLNMATLNQDGSNLNYFFYMLIGSIYFISISLLSFKLFIKRLDYN